ncbi:hypothetical protein J132_08645 [Termitomyces sp. J132]|nr:hypothetical protein J132_08645 [Termitomyces sp. J132]
MSQFCLHHSEKLSIPRCLNPMFSAMEHLICDYRTYYVYPLISLEITLRPLLGLLEKLVTAKKLTLNLSGYFSQSDVRLLGLFLRRHRSVSFFVLHYFWSFECLPQSVDEVMAYINNPCIPNCELFRPALYQVEHGQDPRNLVVIDPRFSSTPIPAIPSPVPRPQAPLVYMRRKPQSRQKQTVHHIIHIIHA